MSLSLSHNLLTKFEFIADLAPFSILNEGVGDVASDVIGSYLLFNVVVVDTVLVRSLKTFKSIFSLAHSCSLSSFIQMCVSWLFPLFERFFCHTLSSPAACGPCLTNCNRTGWIINKIKFYCKLQNHEKYWIEGK